MDLKAVVKVCPHRASAAASASASLLEYIVMLENRFPSITMYPSGDADAAAATDALCGQTLTWTRYFLQHFRRRLCVIDGF